MFNINKLKNKKLDELQSIASDLKIKKVKQQKKMDLIYNILDHQADTSSKNKNENNTEVEAKPERKQRKRVPTTSEKAPPPQNQEQKKEEKPETNIPQTKPKQIPKIYKTNQNINKNYKKKITTNKTTKRKTILTTKSKITKTKTRKTRIPITETNRTIRKKTNTARRTTNLKESLIQKAFWKLCLTITDSCVLRILIIYRLPTMFMFPSPKSAYLV